MGPCSNPKGSEEAGVGLINSEMPPAVLLEGGHVEGTLAVVFGTWHGGEEGSASRGSALGIA